MERQIAFFLTPSPLVAPPQRARQTSAKTESPIQLGLALTQRAWLELLEDEWWPLQGPVRTLHIGAGVPICTSEDSPYIVAWIDPALLPTIEIYLRRNGRWSHGATPDIANTPDVEEIIWPGPIPLFSITSFSVDSEDARLHFLALAKGFSNLAPPSQPIAIDRIRPRTLISEPPADLRAIPLPATWNNLRGAAAMAAWSVPAIDPWLEVLSNTLADTPNFSCADGLGAPWWAEPPWRASQMISDDPQVLFWRAIHFEFQRINLRERWRPLAVMLSIAQKLRGERCIPASWLTGLVDETTSILNDERSIDIERSYKDPMGLALQCVLLRPTPDQFISWKDELRGMPPAVWWTGATLSGMLRGYRDLHPRYRGLSAGRKVIAVRTLQLASQPGDWPNFPGLTESRPSWRREGGRVQLLWNGEIWAERKESSRGKWYSLDLDNPSNRQQAINLARRLSPENIRQIVRAQDVKLHMTEASSVRTSAGGKELEIHGEVTFELPRGFTLEQEIDQGSFRDWLSRAGISSRLEEPAPIFCEQKNDNENSNNPRAGRKHHSFPKDAHTELESAACGRGSPESLTIPGLLIIRDFLSESEEEGLLHEIESGDWLSELSRRVQHYGWRYDYKARRVSSSARIGPLPAWANVLAERLVARGLVAEVPDQVIVNEYIRNQGIAKHVDCVPCFRGPIVTISLCESWELIFRGPRKEKISRQLDRRSAAILDGAARYEWSHEIPKRFLEPWGPRGRRISITFRKVAEDDEGKESEPKHRRHASRRA